MSYRKPWDAVDWAGIILVVGLLGLGFGCLALNAYCSISGACH